MLLCCSMEDAWADSGLQTKSSAEWKALFEEYDKDASGAIDTTELLEAFKDLYIEIEPDELTEKELYSLKSAISDVHKLVHGRSCSVFQNLMRQN